MKAISRADAPVAIEGDGVELRMQKLGGGMTAAFVRVPKGADFRPALAGLPDDLCQCPHWGYLLEGRLKMHTRNGGEVYEAGQAFYWAPGHAPEALEDSELRAALVVRLVAVRAVCRCPIRAQTPANALTEESDERRRAVAELP